MKEQAQRTAVITGASSGIGRATHCIWLGKGVASSPASSERVEKATPGPPAWYCPQSQLEPLLRRPKPAALE